MSTEIHEKMHPCTNLQGAGLSQEDLKHIAVHREQGDTDEKSQWQIQDSGDHHSTL